MFALHYVRTSQISSQTDGFCHFRSGSGDSAASDKNVSDALPSLETHDWPWPCHTHNHRLCNWSFTVWWFIIQPEIKIWLLSQTCAVCVLVLYRVLRYYLVYDPITIFYSVILLSFVRKGIAIGQELGETPDTKTDPREQYTTREPALQSAEPNKSHHPTCNSPQIKNHLQTHRT